MQDYRASRSDFISSIISGSEVLEANDYLPPLASVDQEGVEESTTTDYSSPTAFTLDREHHLDAGNTEKKNRRFAYSLSTGIIAVSIILAAAAAFFFLL